ncbi:MAG TPA: serine/threonine-protein kinase [Kofleriaceae bacterium]
MGPVTDVDRGFVAILTPFNVGRLANVNGEISDSARSSDANGTVALAPTPRVEVSAGLARERAPTVARVLGGRYRLGRQLGAGGYGAVFTAEDTITGERVAIKVLSPAASQNQELIIRFHREAIAASRARHPHIVTIADFDVDEDDGHFIVMEHLDGRDLAQTLADARPLAPVRALTIAAQCARGLAAAHRVGVLHRDLKPANVFLVRRDGGGETVKVIDFGISKLTPLAGDYTDVTSGSKVVGTPSYMSPEQARGARLDARTDVYALGVVLFEMLVGERPFTGRSPLEILGNHLSAPRVAPSTLRSQLADCPGLDALVLRALSPEPEQRFASMEALGDALVACLRAIAPDAAEHVTEPTGEQTDRARWVRDDDEVTSAVSRATPRSRWLGAAAAVIATSIATVGWLAHDRASAPDSHSAVAASPPVPEPLQSPTRVPLPSSPSISSAVVVEPDLPTDNPTSHAVLITSTPRGATVYRGDSRVGITPLTLSIDPADRAQAVTIEATGYRSRRMIVGTDRDHVNVVLFSIRPQKPAARAVSTARGVAEW